MTGNDTLQVKLSEIGMGSATETLCTVLRTLKKPCTVAGLRELLSMSEVPPPMQPIFKSKLGWILKLRRRLVPAVDPGGTPSSRIDSFPEALNVAGFQDLEDLFGFGDPGKLLSKFGIPGDTADKLLQQVKGLLFRGGYTLEPASEAHTLVTTVTETQNESTVNRVTLVSQNVVNLINFIHRGCCSPSGDSIAFDKLDDAFDLVTIGLFGDLKTATDFLVRTGAFPKGNKLPVNGQAEIHAFTTRFAEGSEMRGKSVMILVFVPGSTSFSNVQESDPACLFLRLLYTLCDRIFMCLSEAMLAEVSGFEHNGVLDYLYLMFEKFPLATCCYKEEKPHRLTVVLPTAATPEVNSFLSKHIGQYNQRLVSRFKPTSPFCLLGTVEELLSNIFFSTAHQGWFESETKPLQPTGFGTWLKILISLVPVQIARVENNCLVLCNNTSSQGNVSFGLLDAIFSACIDTQVLVVTSMGKQSTGKSYTLNHLLGVLFDSGGRGTDGCWMSVREFADCLTVALDFEGLCSPERSEQEDLLLSVLNASVSNLTLFKTESLIDRETERMFRNFQEGVGLLKGDDRLFKCCFTLMAKDVPERDTSSLTLEFQTKFTSLSQMFSGKIKMIMCSPLGTRGYNNNLKECVEILKEQTPQFHSGGEFSSMLKLILAKLHLKDWSSLQGQDMVVVARMLQEQLSLAVNYGGESASVGHHGQLVNLSTGEIVPHPESVTISGLNPEMPSDLRSCARARTPTCFKQPTFHIQMADGERLLNWLRLQHIECGTHFKTCREKDAVDGPTVPLLATFIATEIFSVRTLSALGYQCRALVIGSNYNSRYNDTILVADFLKHTCHFTVMEEPNPVTWTGTLDRFLPTPIDNPESAKVASIFYFAGIAKQVGSQQNLLLGDGSTVSSSSTTDLIMPFSSIMSRISAESNLVIAIIDAFQSETTVGGQWINHSGAFTYRRGTEQLARDQLPTGYYLVFSANPGGGVFTKRMFTRCFQDELSSALPGTPFDDIVDRAVTQVQILTSGSQCPCVTDTVGKRFAIF
ncbi:e3 ubiquitin-protein ligase trip12 [Pelomyxa schiedti]|nr:e3 ubiquitin-protein ligase trip12 [Pelomyxa schiedti]